MYYKCNDCGNEFTQLKAVEESRGEFWGIPCSETMYYCPFCDGDDVEEIEGEFDGPIYDPEGDYYDALIDEQLSEDDEEDEYYD